MDELAILIDAGFNIILPVALVVLGYITGRTLERRHYRSIRAREEANRDLLVIQTKLPPPGYVNTGAPLVIGSVVISSDYFKSFLAALRMLVGGRVRSFESLLDRARREAMLRLKEQARAAGADMVVNVRLETVRVFGHAHRQMRSVEAIAYGTALKKENH